MLSLGLIRLVLLCMEPSQPVYPARLRAVLDSAPPNTSQIEWTVTWNGGYDDGLVERFITRTTGDTLWQSNLGDENGFHRTWFRRTAPGSADDGIRASQPPSHILPDEVPTYGVSRHESAGTNNFLISEQRIWNLPQAERPIAGRIAPKSDEKNWFDEPPVDVARIGLAAYFGALPKYGSFRIPAASAEGFESATFREGSQGGLATISAEYGTHLVVWSFDDRKGGQPVRTELYAEDKLFWSSETEVERLADRWFPKTTRFFKGDSATPYKIIEVTRATFDQPWHMQEISPEDIGVLNGTQFDGPDGELVWTGADLMPAADYWNMVHLYDELPDPKVQALLAEFFHFRSADEYVAYLRRVGKTIQDAYWEKYRSRPWVDIGIVKDPEEKDPWDEYVDRFLEEHKLPDAGVQRARKIGKSAKRLRDIRRAQYRWKIEKVRREGDTRILVHYADAEKRIFDRMLVRPLDRLVPDKRAKAQAP